MLLVLVMMLSLAACGETAAPAASEAPAAEGSTEPAAPAEGGENQAFDDMDNFAINELR